MTTLVALATKDALVMGCDSLGSFTLPMVHPLDLAHDFFDSKNDWKLKTNEKGEPILKNLDDIYKKSQAIPFNQMTHVTKLFSFEPLEMGVMSTGIASIGMRTIKSLINEFKTEDKAFRSKSKPTNYTIKSISTRFLNFINKYYLQQYPDERARPDLEFMIGGYDKQKPVPAIYRILVKQKEIDPAIENTFGIAFGGQMQEIQRIVFGTDAHNRINLIRRITDLFDKYRNHLQQILDSKNINEKLPPAPSNYGEELHLFKNWDLDGFDADWGDFSEQNAIGCVHFFVEIMIKSQQFSSRLPTVGGEVHIALINKKDGFRFMSREEYEHEGYTVPKEAL